MSEYRNNSGTWEEIEQEQYRRYLSGGGSGCLGVVMAFGLAVLVALASGAVG